MSTLRRSYGAEDRERGLQVLVMEGGNAQRAHDKLTAAGYDIPRRTLDEWRRQHADRYAELQLTLRPKLEDKIAAESEALIVAIGEKEREIVHLLDPAQLPPKELAGALRNLSTSKALQVDKIQGPLRGRPTIIEHRSSPDELLARLTKVLGPGSIESTAEELPSEALLPETAASNAHEGSSAGY